MPLLVSLSFIAFGITEFAARLVPILSCALMVFYLTKITQKYFNNLTAIFLNLFLIFSPMMLYFSKIPVHETVVLGFTAATFWHYLLWYKDKKTTDFKLLLLFLFLSQLTSWSGFYLSAILPLHFILTAKSRAKKQRSKLLIIFGLAFVTFALHNLHMSLIASTKEHQTLFKVFLFRLNIGDQAKVYSITLPRFIINQLRFIAIYFTRIMGLLSITWLIAFSSKLIKRNKISFNHSIIATLFVFGFTHNLVFRNLAYIHDYMLIYAAPFFALASATILEKIYTALKVKPDIKIALLGIVFLLFATERLEYLNALKTHGMDNSSPEIGRVIQNLTQPQDKILVLSPQYMQFHDVFLKYYADRRVQPAKKLTPGYLTGYDYVVVPKSHDYVSLEDKETLRSFPSFDQNQAIIYDIRNAL